MPDALLPLFTQTGRLCHPVLFYDGRLVSFSKTGKVPAHVFGGPLPACHGVGAPEFHRLVFTINLPALDISFGSKKIPSLLPLICNFDLNSLSTDYVVDSERLNFRHPNCFFGRMQPQEDSELPYPSYPHQFPKTKFGIGIVHPIKFDTFQKLCTAQGLHGTVDEPDISGHLFVVIPQCEALGVSLWAEPGDPNSFLADDNLCVFDFDPKTRRVDASNQCTQKLH